MYDKLRESLKIPQSRLDAINAVLMNPDSRAVNDFLKVVAKYGTPEEINRKAAEAGKAANLLARVKAAKPEYLDDLNWLREQRDKGAFVKVADYRKGVLGAKADSTVFADGSAVTLEVSALQYFPWLIAAAKRAIKDKTLMPGRWIKVRNMKEQEADGDLAAIAAGMDIIGASYVETLDTKGTDGSNIHLGGPATITGYFGGIGEPNHYPLKWVDEFLYYYTNYGVKQVLVINPGTVLVSYMLYKLGIDIEFKISVFMGNDNPYAGLWTIMAAKLFSRDDGSTPLIGFNWSNSINNETMEISAQFRKDFGFEHNIRFEHHITETFKSIVLQPYNRRDELVQVARSVANISAKHEGGDPEIDGARPHPSDILDYFREKAEVISSGEWDAMQTNFLDKFDACNRTAKALTENGLSFVAAANLHK
ncbi:MAG: hypothetical protein E4H20_04995 [Spirochaetales bacterium]|nr:MAG: hypothetical protein E4H20_04995 [Spirochaetales bacterium]